MSKYYINISWRSSHGGLSGLWMFIWKTIPFPQFWPQIDTSHTKIFKTPYLNSYGIFFNLTRAITVFFWKVCRVWGFKNLCMQTAKAQTSLHMCRLDWTIAICMTYHVDFLHPSHNLFGILSPSEWTACFCLHVIDHNWRSLHVLLLIMIPYWLWMWQIHIGSRNFLNSSTRRLLIVLSNGATFHFWVS